MPDLTRIKLLVLDVDGVLTDGSLYYSVEGLQLKAFHSKDGLGLKLLMHGGIQIALLSGDASPITRTRAGKLGIPHVLLGIEDKLTALEEFATEHGLAMSDIAYMGDDLNDLPCLTAVGFGACPADAVAEVRAAAHHVCALPGGRGCVREVCDLIRVAQNIPVVAAGFNPGP